jgi:tRNA-dihydrouridine synthase
MSTAAEGLWLAPLRGVTIRTFRSVFGDAIREAGFSGLYAPFIPVNAGFRFSKRLFADILPKEGENDLALVPQAIGKDPAALREWCKAVRDLGYVRADLNAGCPFPMIRRKGRGSGLLRTPDALDRMLAAGCEAMGAGNFSVKTRLGMERPDELLALMPIFNRYPLAVLTVHARTARQMYEGAVDRAAFEAVAAAAKVPVMYNGDAPVVAPSPGHPVMVGRRFIRALANRPDAPELLVRYAEASRRELCGEAPVLGRLKELLSYWCQEPGWRSRWSSIKICRSVDELLLCCKRAQGGTYSI